MKIELVSLDSRFQRGNNSPAMAADSKLPDNFGDIAFTPSVRSIQEKMGSRAAFERLKGVNRRTRLGPEEQAFISQRDSFYMATVDENGWPYVQHRGGPRGLLQVIDEQTLGFVDFRGNRQYLSAGNVSATNHTCLFLMDYPAQERLKIWAEAEISEDATLIARLALPGYPGVVERAFVFNVLAFDWNCQQHIVRRYTPDEYLAKFGPGPVCRERGHEF